MDQTSDNTNVTQILFEPQPLSRLLSLPGELRNRIYCDAVVEETKVEVTTKHHHDSEGVECFTVEPTHPLLFASKQIRHEAWEIYWTENAFELQDEMVTSEKVKALISMIGNSAHKMTTVALTHTVEYQQTEGGPHSYYRVAVSVKRTVQNFVFDLECRANSRHESKPCPFAICKCKVDGIPSGPHISTVLDVAEAYSREVLSKRKAYDRNRTIHCWICAREAVL